MRPVRRTEALRRESARLAGQLARLAKYTLQLEDALERQSKALVDLRRLLAESRVGSSRVSQEGTPHPRQTQGKLTGELGSDTGFVA